MGMCSLQPLCPRFIFTHSIRFGPLVALRKCHTFVPNLRANQQNSSHHSIHQNSSHRSIRHHSNHRSRKCQWYISVQILACLSLSLISSFQDVRTSFRCFALVQAFGTLVRTFGSFGFPLIFLLEFGIGPRPCACVLDKRADDLDIAEEPAHMELEHSAPLFLQQDDDCRTPDPEVHRWRDISFEKSVHASQSIDLWCTPLRVWAPSRLRL